MPAGYVPDATNHTLLTFKSTRILSTGNGKLEVIGDLTLTRVERTVIAVPTEAYAGSVYGDPVIHNETYEITFLFPSVSAAHLSEPFTPAMVHTKGVLEIVGSASVDGEDFPELLSARKETNFSVGQDHSGPQCTPATGSQTAIVLDLEFLHKVPEASVEAHSGAESIGMPPRPIAQVKLTKAT